MIERDLLNFLKGLSLFRELKSDQDFERIRQWIQLKTFEPGEYLTRQNSRNQQIYLLLSGSVEISINGVAIDSIRIEPGNVIGEVEFFNQSPCSATVKATEKTLTGVLAHDDLSHLIQTYPSIGLNLYQAFSTEILAKLKSVTDELIELTTGNPLSHLAHDFQSPLAALKTLTQSIPDDQVEDKKLLEFILDRMIRMSEALLRKKPKQLDSHLEFVALPRFSRSIESILYEKQSQLNLSSNSSTKKTIHFQPNFIFERASTEGVYLEQTHFERILSNLLDNSIQAIKSNGKIQILLDTDGNFVHLKIEDDGMGIPKHILEQLGKSKVTYGKTNGNGIGLYQTYQRVRLWNGIVQTTSQEGKGTQVHISLPITRRSISS